LDRDEFDDLTTPPNLKHERRGKIQCRFGKVLFTSRSLVQDAESAEIMITVPVPGGQSAGFTSHELLSHVQRVMDQMSRSPTSCGLPADVSRIGNTATCPFAETTLMSKEYLKCSANHDISRIRWLPRNSKKVGRVGNESCLSGRFVITATHSLLLRRFPEAA
jgi:hypothetical protein